MNKKQLELLQATKDFKRWEMWLIVLYARYVRARRWFLNAPDFALWIFGLLTLPFAVHVHHIITWCCMAFAFVGYAFLRRHQVLCRHGHQQKAHWLGRNIQTRH